MDSVLKGIELVSLGLRSNLFGLGCPAHCASPGLGTVLAAFLGGFCCGVSVAVYLVWLLWTFPGPVDFPAQNPEASVPAGSPGFQRRVLQLTQYLHGQQVQHQSRRRHH